MIIRNASIFDSIKFYNNGTIVAEVSSILIILLAIMVFILIIIILLFIRSYIWRKYRTIDRYFDLKASKSTNSQKEVSYHKAISEYKKEVHEISPENTIVHTMALGKNLINILEELIRKKIKK